MQSTGFKGLSEQELLDFIGVSITRGRSPTGMGSSSNMGWHDQNAFAVGLASQTPLNSPGNRAVWRNDRRMAIFHNMGDAAGAGCPGAAVSSNETLRAFLISARADPSILKTTEAEHVLAVEIGKKLFDLLLKPHDEINTAWPLVDLGLHSLVAIELRAWWKQMFAFDISVLEILRVC